MSLVKRMSLILAGIALCAILAIAIFIAYSVFHGRAVPPAQPGTIKLACVGDSITYGILSGGYPEYLGKRLGNAYSVRNFGAIGYTLQKDGNLPYWGHRYFRLSTEFAPDLVLIMLGTNDSKDKNWKGGEVYTRDYMALIAHYQSLPSRPRVLLMTSPSAFLKKGHAELPSGMNAAVIAEIGTIVQQIGKALSIPVIDIHAATADHPEFFPTDGIHPDAEGDKFIADKVFEVVKSQEGEKR